MTFGEEHHKHTFGSPTHEWEYKNDWNDSLIQLKGGKYIFFTFWSHNLTEKVTYHTFASRVSFVVKSFRFFVCFYHYTTSSHGNLALIYAPLPAPLNHNQIANINHHFLYSVDRRLSSILSPFVYFSTTLLGTNFLLYMVCRWVITVNPHAFMDIFLHRYYFHYRSCSVFVSRQLLLLLLRFLAEILLPPIYSCRLLHH